MLYHREFTISSCHFNGSEVYRAYRELRDPVTLDDGASPIVKIIRLQMIASQVMAGTHGHNFKIGVEIDDHFEPINDYLVDDVLIESIVMRWHNTNLSVHPDFKGLRATTENMAYLLSRKIMQLLRNRAPSDEFIGPTITVRVYETDQIYAMIVVDMADEPQLRGAESEETEEAID
jgi:6-pyruvoyl-tetrahydropterin synthase